MLIVLLTLILICSIVIVFIYTDITDNTTHDKDINVNNDTNNIIPSLKHYNPLKVVPGVLKLFGHEKKYGYWVWSGDMDNVDFDKLSKNGVNVVFLNAYAFTDHNKTDVLNWIKEANDHGIEVHIWMQIFNTGDWKSPVKNGKPDTEYFNKRINEGKYYAGLEGVSGVQMDYIRYEGNAYKDKNGTAAVTQFVKDFSKAVKEENPSITVSATVMPECENDPYYYGQDIPEMGKYVDVIVPMMYKGNYEANSTWIKETTAWFENNSGDAEVWVGLQTYQSDFNVTDLPAHDLMKDSESCFDNGANGVVYFKWGMNKELDNKKLN